MSLSKTSRFSVLSSLIFVVMFFAVIPANAQLYDLEVKVADAEGNSGQQDVPIAIYMKNWADTVAGFELFLVLEHNLVCEFQTRNDTLYDTSFYKCYEWLSPGVCDPDSMLEVTDSVLIYPSFPYDSMHDTVYYIKAGNHDVSGTLVSNWEDVSSASIGTSGHNLKIIGRANEIPPPYTPGIGFPQWGTIPLIKMLADIYDIPEEQEERDVRIYIQHDNLDNFSFSNEAGTGIGVITDTIYDTTWYECLDWDGDECLFYQEVSTGPADSFSCCDTLLSGHLDTSNVKIESGVLTVLTGICGDVNCNSALNLLDATYMIAYLYKGGPVPCEMWRADMNGNGSVNLLDVTYLIAYLYKGGPEPICGG